MRINKLHLQNFRCFEELTVEFHPQMNILIGDNASGKTTLLDAIATILSGEVPDNSEKLNFPSATQKNLKIGADRYNISLKIEGKREYELNIHYREGVSTTAGTSFGMNEIEKAKNKPLILHYPADRAFYDTAVMEKETQDNEISDEYLCYRKAFSFEQVRMREFIIWFREEEYFENVEKIKHKNWDLKNASLETMRNAIMVFLSTIMQMPFTNLRIEQTDRIGVVSARFGTKPIALMIDKGGISLQIDQLSAGEKIVLMFVCDITRRLILANPERNPLEGEGIVLIDEIDLHLHPKWQKNIIKALKTTFPKIQFIITTHSPLILSTADKGEVLNLSEIKDKVLKPNQSSYQGLDLDFIVQGLMGLGFPEVEVKDVETALERWVLLEKREKRETPYLIEASGKSYSLIDILREVETHSETGNKFRRDLIMLTIELLFRGKEKLPND